MKRKKRWGDRRDGTKIRNLDSMHCIMPLIFPKRCESEVFMHERIDLTRVNEYIREKNRLRPEVRYSLFHIIITAMLKTIVLRPDLNRFIANQNIYQRNELSASFIVKTSLSDDAEEAMAFVYAQSDDTLDTIHKKVNEQIKVCRDENQKDSSQKSMDVVSLLPSFVRMLIGVLVRYLDRHGMMPKFIIANDPHYASVMFTQLGSIKLNAWYHHLTDWGTNSIFMTVGEKKMRPFYDVKGNITMKSSIDLGITVDERISDGFYFAKSIKLMKKLLEHPELLELPLDEAVRY